MRANGIPAVPSLEARAVSVLGRKPWSARGGTVVVMGVLLAWRSISLTGVCVQALSVGPFQQRPSWIISRGASPSLVQQYRTSFLNTVQPRRAAQVQRKLLISQVVWRVANAWMWALERKVWVED